MSNRRIKMEIEIVVDDELKPEDIILVDDDVVDGFTLTRRGNDIIDVFHLKSAEIIKMEDVPL